MSNSMSTGYYSNQSNKQKERPCPQAKNGVHEWKKFGTWPSVWYECKHCNESIYDK